MVPAIPAIKFFTKSKEVDDQVKKEALERCLQFVNPEQDAFLREQFLNFLSAKNPFTTDLSTAVLINRVNALSIYFNFAKNKLRKGINKSIFEADYAKHILACYTDCIERKMSIHPRQFYLILTIVFWIRSKLAILSFGTRLIDSIEQDFENPVSTMFKGVAKETYLQIFALAKEHMRNASIRLCLEEFLDSVQAYPHTAHLPIRFSPQRRIIIIGKLAGGGHRTPMLAMEKLFKERGAAVLTLEMNELEDRYDVLHKRNVRFEDGTLMSRIELYNRWSGQEKEEFLVALLLSFSTFMQTTFPENYSVAWGAQLIQILTDFKPDIVLTTVGQPSELAWIAGRINRPFIYFHTDPIFNPDAQKIYRAQQFLPPELRFFSIATALTEQEDYPPCINWKDPSIEITGVPCREEFVPCEDPATLRAKKERWGCLDHEKVYAISRGLFGARDHILPAIQDLLDPRYPIDRPMRVIVVCGANSQLKTELEALTASYPTASKCLRFLFTGKLSGAEMAEVYQISDIVDTKAGGASVTEFLAVVGSQPSTKRAILTPEYALEVINAVHVEKKGLGLMYNRRDPNQRHRMELISTLMQAQPVASTVLDWRGRIAEMVERKIKQHQETFGPS